jgi:hypothetical protein
VVLAWALDRIGLSGAGWLAAVVVMGWGLAVGAALVAARRVGGEAAARRAAPALAILPAAIWAGTSVDALFAGLVAVGLALAVAAVARPAGAGPTAVAAGVVSGTALLCTYGAVPPVLVGGTLVVVLAGRRAPHLSALIGGGAALPLLLAAGAGFWWPAGLAATRAAYWSGIGAERPGGYLTFAGNPGALALAVGPAVAVGLATLARPAVDHVAAAATARRGGHRVGSAGSARPATRPGTQPATVAGTGVDVGPAQGSPRDWLLPVAALVAVALADLSQLARGEVERIWLPFVPWLALAAPGDRRGWLGAQVGLALLLQSFLASPW